MKNQKITHIIYLPLTSPSVKRIRSKSYKPPFPVILDVNASTFQPLDLLKMSLFPQVRFGQTQPEPGPLNLNAPLLMVRRQVEYIRLRLGCQPVKGRMDVILLDSTNRLFSVVLTNYSLETFESRPCRL